MSTRPYFDAVTRQTGAAGAAGSLPVSRYVLPQFEERTAYGFKRQDPYAKLFEDRIVFMGVQVDDASADDIMAQLLVLESQDPDGLITMYINSPGGSFTALTAIYDTMQYVQPDVATVATGLAASMGQHLLSAGAKGKRYLTPHARVLMHQPSGGAGGSATDIRINADLIIKMKQELAEITAANTGHTVEEIIADSDRDHWFSAQEALEYGFVDHIVRSSREIGKQNGDN